jgi:hypothetical protein
MPELSELFNQAKALNIDFNDEAAKAAAIQALKDSWPGFYQSVANVGFGAAQAKFTSELTAEKTAREAAETKLREETERHQTQIRELQDKAPDVKAVNTQWETKLTEAREEHRKQQQKLRDRNRNVLLQRDQATLQAELEARGVPKANARILAKDPDLLPSRADYADDDQGTLSVRLAGQQIPFAPGIGQSHLSLLAEEVVARPEVKEILKSDVDTGGGVSGGGQPGTGDKAFYDNLRKRVQDTPTEGMPTKPLRERVGGR